MTELGSAFISYTSDLADYPSDRSFVQETRDAVLKAGLRPVDMGYFSARDTPPAEYCQRAVRACSIYIAVVGFRYGSRVPDRADDVSYTEFEFLTATDSGIPRLVFLLSEDALLPRRLMDRDLSAVEGFRQRLRHANMVVKNVSTPTELAEAVLHALYEERSSRGQGHQGDYHISGTMARMIGQRRPWMAPPRERTVDRPELGNQLIGALTAPESAEVGLTTGLQGAGGFGKTRLATWACHRPEIERRYPGGLLWVTVGQETQGAALAERVNDLAFMLSGERPAISDPDAAGAELGRLLDEQRPVLLVVDDVWTDRQLRPFRHGGRECTRLVTTRIQDLLPANGPHIRVDAMTIDQACRLVADDVRGLAGEAAERLAIMAGRWPVLLNLINGVLRRRVEHGQLPDQAAKEITERLVREGPAAFDPARPADRSQAVAATVNASLGLLSPADQERYLDLAIFPEDVDIPLDILTLLWPDCRVDVLCEELVDLGLVASYRFNILGPRLVLHDVMHAFLRGRRRGMERVRVHQRLVAASHDLLPTHDERAPAPWFALPANAGYLWRFLPYHLHEAGLLDELSELVCDLRWVEAKTRWSGSVVAVEGDLALVDTPTSHTLRRTLGQAAQLLGPIDPPAALGATLASRLHGVSGLESVLDSYLRTLPRPRLEPAWPLPDRPDLSQPSTTGHNGAVTCCALSPDGTVLASTGDDGTARLWQVATGTEIAVLSGHTGGVWGCAFSPDGALLATASDDRTVRLWRIADGSEQQALAGHSDSVTSCAFSPDGALLATTSVDRTVRLWQVATSAEQAVLGGHAGGVTDCAFSPDGMLLAAASDDGTVRLWQVTDGAERAMLASDASTRGMWGCAFSPEGTLLATASDDGTVRLWRVADGTEQAVLTGHTARVWDCAFSPDGALLATASDDGTARLWQVADGTILAVLTGHTSRVNTCVFSFDGTLLATASIDGTVRLWDVTSRSERAVLAGRTDRPWGCAFSPDGALLAVTSQNGAIRLWAVADRSEQSVLTGHTSWAWGCAFSRDGALLTTTSIDRTVRLWQVATGTEQAVLTGHTGWVRGCAFSPDGTLIAAAGDDWTVRLWQVATGAEYAVLTGHTSRVNACAFSLDGTLLATAGIDGTARLWQVATGTEHAVLTGHTNWVTDCAFSPDGTLLATTSDDRTARLWQVATGTERAILTGHTNWLNRCAFSPEGTVLATTSRDQTVRLWQVATGRCHCALRVAGPLIGIAWHPNATMLCAVSGAGIYLLTYRP